MSDRLLVVGVDTPTPPFLAQLLRGLRDRGRRVTIAAARPADPGLADDWLPIPPGTGLPLRAAAGLAVRRPVRAVRATRPLAAGARSRLHDQILRTVDTDVVYVPWIAHAVDRPALFDGGAPVLVSCRGSQVNVAPQNPRRRSLAAGLADVFARSAGVHCVSDAIRDVAGGFGLDPGRATVIRPGVDLHRFTPDEDRRGDGPLRLLIVGTLTWRKGVEYAAIGARRALDAGIDLRLDLVGAERDGGAARHAVHDLGLDGVTTFHGALEPDQVPLRLRAADAVLVPSVTEGIANAALEAMATRRAVVVTSVGGMEEVVTDGVDGLVVAPREPEAIAAAIIELAEPGRRDRLAAAGRRRVEEAFGLDDHVDAFARLLDATAGTS
ncbi:MAG: glycosyltransferase family 4 protein [Actinomycetota bacterium]